MTNKAVACFLLGLALTGGLCSGGGSHAQFIDDLMRVTGCGRAAGLGGGTRQAAIEDAQRRILERSLATMAGAEALGLLEPILSVPSRYVAGSSLVSEERDGETLIVTIEAWVDHDALAARAAELVLARMARPPNVALLVVEGGHGDGAAVQEPPGLVEQKLYDQLREEGIEVVAPEAVRSRYPASALQDIAQHMTEDTAIAADFALGNRADATIAVQAFIASQASQRLTKVLTSTAVLTARVVRAPDGKLVEVKRTEAVVHSADAPEGIAQAARDACAKLANDIKTALILGTVTAERPHGIIVTIKVGDEYELLSRASEAFCDAFEGFAIRELYRKRDSVCLYMPYDGEMGGLVGRIEKLQGDGFRLEPRTIVENEVEIWAVSDMSD